MFDFEEIKQLHVVKFSEKLSNPQRLAIMTVFFGRAGNMFKFHFSLSLCQRLLIINVANERRNNLLRLVHQGFDFIQSSRTKNKASTYYLSKVDRDRTVSQRSKPSSCTALIGEQPNPWNRFQLQDAISRHRGAKPLHR